MGAQGEALERQAAWATVQLAPMHSGTPWVTLEGSPILMNDDDGSLGYTDLLR